MANNESITDSKTQATRAALKLVGVYAVFASLWILLSDKAVSWLFDDLSQVTQASLIKGWLFVAVTSLLLLNLIRRLLDQLQAAARAERSAQGEERRVKILLEVLAESSPDSIFAKDLDGRYLLCNQAAAQALGKPAAEVIGCDDSALFPPAQAAMIRATDLCVLAEQQVKSYDEAVSTAYGERIYQTIKGPLRNGGGRVIGTFGISRDISELKRIEQALRASEVEFRAYFNTDAFGSAMISPDGRFLKVNDALCQITGYSAAELLRIGPAALTHPDDAAVVNEVLLAHQRGQVPIYKAEKRILRKDGQTIWIQVDASLIRDDDGGVLCSAGTVYEITERKKAEVQLQAALALAESATRAKSEFLAHMSHEIRTPINAIVGAARLIEYENLTSTQRDYAEIMRYSSQSLLSLIDDILDLSKIEAGQIPFKAEPFALLRMLESLLSTASILASGKNIDVSLDLAPDVPPCLIGDAHRLEQVLNNLLANAVKFTPRGAVILRVQLLAAGAEEVRLRFVVSDTGIGISPEQVDKIFDAFVQAEDTMTRTHEGIGLGLAISRELVALMGGHIEVDSVPGSGSNFSFSAVFKLPSAAEAEAALARFDRQQTEPDMFPPAALPLAGRRVLMVEDNAFNRVVQERMLQYLGLEVDIATNGAEAIACCRDGHHYDAILMDLHLPDLDGFSCTRAIRALPDGGQVPIIAFTANVLATTAKACREAGMNDHLLKPVEPETLQGTLAHWILGEQSLDEVALPAPAIAQTDSLPEALPGLDVEKAATWSHGSASALEKLLERMLSHTADDPVKLSEQIALGDIEAAARITHDLMGMAATVGASTLGGAARLVNREIRDGKPNSALAQEGIASIGAELSQLKLAREILQQRHAAGASAPSTI